MYELTKRWWIFVTIDTMWDFRQNTKYQYKQQLFSYAELTSLFL